MNKNDNRRREILAGYLENENGRGGITPFSGVPLKVLETLINEGFAEPDDQQNSAPTIAEMRDFMQEWPEMTAHGFIVHIERSDYSVSLEGVEFKGTPSIEMVCQFAQLFNHADDFICSPTHLYCWFD